MEFDKDSSKIIKPLLNAVKDIPANDSLTNNKKFNKSLDNLLLLIYKDIHRAEEYTKKHIDRVIKMPSLERNIVEPENTTTDFYPSNIKEYIKSTIKYQMVYTFTIEQRKFTIYFGIFTEKDIHTIDKYNDYIQFIFSWLYICCSFSLHNCSHNLDIFIYMTPYKKKLPTEPGVVIDSEHINSAYTKNCVPNNQIVIFREEEWRKVFIHETFHSFGFDPSQHQADEIKKTISKLYPINSDFLVYETYVEIWARILNAAYDSYYSLSSKKDVKNFLLYLKFSLQIERIFSIQQMCKILNFMGLEYSDIIDKKKLDNVDDESDHQDTDHLNRKRLLYKENTNVFAYYILTSVLINNYYYFLLWCAKNNANIYNFSRTNSSTQSFTKFITEQFGDPSLFKAINYLWKKLKSKREDKYLLYTTRMSAIEIV